MQLKILAAAAAAALVATPALAEGPQRFAGPKQHSADKTGTRVVDSVRFSTTRAYYNEPRSGFWPADVAAGVVGGAIGTAGAIANAPFGGSYADYGPYPYYDRYAWYNEPYTGFWPVDHSVRAVRATAPIRTNYVRYERYPSYDGYAGYDRYPYDARYAYDNEPYTGFPPLDFAAGVTGAAISTAGAVATAPIRGSYAAVGNAQPHVVQLDPNGPKCVPGTMTTINGNRMRCQ